MVRLCAEIGGKMIGIATFQVFRFQTGKLSTALSPLVRHFRLWDFRM